MALKLGFWIAKKGLMSFTRNPWLPAWNCAKVLTAVRFMSVLGHLLEQKYEECWVGVKIAAFVPKPGLQWSYGPSYLQGPV